MIIIKSCCYYGFPWLLLTISPHRSSLKPGPLMLWPWKWSLMKTQTQILDNRLYYTRKRELHRKGKKSRTVRITPILICSSGSKISQY